MTRLAALLLLLALADAAPQREYFRYQRLIAVSAAGQACLALDPAVFAHSAPQLADLRLYRDGAEVPYVLRTAATPSEGKTQAFDLLNKGEHQGRVSFDAELPSQPYSDIEIEILAKDFIATVTVTASRDRSAKSPTKLGSFTVFDLSRQCLGRSTVLHLPISDLPWLHFEIAGPLHPEQVTAVQVQRQTSAAPTYVVIAATTQIERRGKQSLAVFTLPAHVPVDRVFVEPAAQSIQFSRAATVAVAPGTPPTDGSTPQTVVTTGYILRVHSTENGQRIDEEQLSLDPPQNYLDGPTRWTVSIDNGDDAPLALRQIRLEMLERRLCFEAAPGAVYTLFYGDSALSAPRYDYASLFAERANAARATLGPEQPNPAYKPRPDLRPFTEKHPALLSIALAAVVLLLGFIALRSLPKGPRRSS
ncbi:MAG: DUF3999 family protein [Terracidiphilus sp.]|nr:DUF3999 family protein [Terracidiphilus sp.]